MPRKTEQSPYAAFLGFAQVISVSVVVQRKLLWKASADG